MKNEKLVRNAIVAAVAVIIGILMIVFKETGLFYLLCAVAIVFVIWGYIHKESLIDFEDRVWARVKHFLRKNKKRRKSDGYQTSGKGCTPRNSISQNKRKVKWKEPN